MKTVPQSQLLLLKSLTRMNGKRLNIAIVGGGLGGTLLASHLAKDHHKITLFENREDPRNHGFSGGRSINLAISKRGFTALKHINLDEKIKNKSLPMGGRMMHHPNKQEAYQPYSLINDECIYSISRSILNIELINNAERFKNVTLIFGSKITKSNIDDATIVVNDKKEYKFDLIVGCDGTYSKIRSEISKKINKIDEVLTLEHGYKELHIPPQDNNWALNPKCLHIWPHGGSMMIALPNLDHSFTCTLFWPYKGNHSFEEVNEKFNSNPNEINSFFEKNYPSAFKLIPNLIPDWNSNPISSLPMVKCSQYHYGETAVLLGDAAHAIVPFYGQGMNCAFEDVHVLVKSLRDYSSVKDALLNYNNLRKPNGDAIRELALDNFIEMRDKVSKKIFLFEKKIGQILYKKFPNLFKPVYNIVSFSNIPYQDALKKSKQRKLIKKITICSLLAILMWLIFILT